MILKKAPNRVYFIQLTMLLVGALGLVAAASAHNHPAYVNENVTNEDFDNLPQPFIDLLENNWMTPLDGNLRLSDLSIPGTHDSLSHFGGDLVKTQGYRLKFQLLIGVRAFDIRARHVTNTAFAIHHGQVFQNAFFGTDVLEVLIDFLNQNPGETVFMRVKQEHTTANEVTVSFQQTFEYYRNLYGANNFWTPPPGSNGQPYGWGANPTLDEVRGRIVVLQDFSTSPSTTYGIGWGSMDIQDEFSLSSQHALYGKWEAVKQHYADTLVGDSDEIYVNFLSGAGSFPFVWPYFVASGHSNPATGAPRLATGRTTPAFNGTWPDFPRVNCFIGICTIAFEGTNVLFYDLISTRRFLADSLAQQGVTLPMRAGIVMVDFPGPAFVRQIASLNDYAQPPAPAPNAAPVAMLNAYQGTEGATATLDASQSSDPEGGTLRYRWDFDDDGAYDTDWLDSAQITRTWDDDFQGSVTVLVRDNLDAESTAIANVVVNNVSPGFVAIPKQVTAQCGASVAINNIQFADPGSLDTHFATVDWGDGTPLERIDNVDAAGYSVSHSYASAGQFKSFHQVEDDDGGKSNSTQVSVDVVDSTAPTLTASSPVTALWPPNNKLETIRLVINSSDECGAPKIELTLSCDDAARCDSGDMVVVDDSTIQLRAERAGNGNGRTYTVFVRATDDSANVAEHLLKITVPHDNSPPDDDESANATGGGSALGLPLMILLYLFLYMLRVRAKIVV